GGMWTSDPTAVWQGEAQLDVFIRGTDNALWHKQWVNGSWHDESLGGVWTSSPAVTEAAGIQLDVFIRGTDNALWHKQWVNGSWHGWESLGGEWISGAAAAVQGWGTLDVFVRGPDNALWRKQLQFDLSWSAWEALSVPAPLTLDADNFEEEWK